MILSMTVTEESHGGTPSQTGNENVIIDDLDLLLDVLPPYISQPLRQQGDCRELLEVVMDLGRPPEARFHSREVILDSKDVAEEDIEYVVSRVSPFSGDNRGGIERTLHRVSAIRNRQGRVIGLTCRVGRAVLGAVRLIEDLSQSSKSILLLGRPGVGKTTMLREVARVLADDLRKRVVIVDTSNEIAGDGDIPHPAIGHARRMQVPTPAQQHAVMIEAVENHMPEAIIIDEIGTELEAAAARTIAERGVQLVGTAHGNALENLIMNPTLADLAGGLQAVTLGDEEARRRGTQKSVLERKAPPTFDVVVEIQDFNQVAIHPDVGEAVDAILRGRPVTTETRWLDSNHEVQSQISEPVMPALANGSVPRYRDVKSQAIYPFGVNHSKLEQAVREMHLPLNIVGELDEAEIVVTSRNYYRRKPQKLRDAEAAELPIYVLKSSTTGHIKQFLDSICSDVKRTDAVRHALEEAEEAVTEVREGRRVAELNPQNAYIRRLQHILAQKYQLSSSSQGEGSQRRVVIFRGDDYPMSGDASVDVLGEEHDDPAFESGAGTE
jgi:stage III sporulation protein SpoIIIAA